MLFVAALTRGLRGSLSQGPLRDTPPTYTYTYTYTLSNCEKKVSENGLWNY